MGQPGKYLYGIIGETHERHFDAPSMGGRGDLISTLGYQGISAVISNTPITPYPPTPENLICHERAIETVMQEYTILPFRFCSIATHADEIRTILRKRYVEFKGLLRDMDNKIELGVSALWKDMETVFHEVRKTPSVQSAQMEWQQQKDRISAKSALGKAVETALEIKRKEEATPVLTSLSRLCVDQIEKEPRKEDMVINAVCLIDRTREKSFDFLMEELAEQYAHRLQFACVGPAPPFHFVSIEIASH